MLRPLVLTLALSACAEPIPPPAPPPPPAATTAATPSEPPLAEGALSYTLRPVPASGGRIQVDLRFHPAGAGPTRLRLPDQGWGEEHALHDAVEALEAIGEGVTLQRTAPEIATIEHPAGAVVHVRYRLHQDWTGDRIRRFRPSLTEGWFHFFGFGALIQPDAVDADAPRPIDIGWEDVPAGFTLADSFGIGPERRVFTAPLARLREAVFVGGDFRLHRVDVSGEPLWVAVRGTWSFPDTALVSLLQQLVTTERGFFNDHTFPHYLVTLMQDGGHKNYSGSGCTNAFSALAAPDRGLDDGLELLFSHELFHTWNGKTIRTPPPEGGSYWFSEGLTTYYGRLLALRAGVIALPRYVAELDDEIRRYWLSSVRDAPNSRVVTEFWRDHAVHDLPYQRGDLLAHAWNTGIRAATSGRASLDDVMRDALAAARDRDERITPASLDALVKKHLPAGVAGDVERYVERGETIAPRPDALGPCVRLQQDDIPSFELGFARASIDAKVIRGVLPGSAAQRAGLRDGQTFRGGSIWFGDVTREARIDIEDAHGKRSITYRPLGPKQRVPQYHLDEKAFARDPKRCLAWFGP